MKLSNAEKLILMMLCDVHQHLEVDPDSGINAGFVKEAILSDNAWGIDWEYSMLFHDSSEPTPPKVTEVVNYLDMWRFIELAFRRMKAPDKERLRNELGVFGEDPRFRGFDGNNESEYMSIATFLIEEMNRFQELRDHQMNSHMPMVGTYRRMWSLFEQMRRRIVHTGAELTADDLIVLLKRS